MSFTIGNRDDLMVDLGEAVAPGQPVRLFVIFRIEGFTQFKLQYGDGTTDALVGHIVRCLPEASGPSGFYFRPRRDELCALISGRLDGVEEALFEAANAVYQILGSKGISLDFGTAVLPYEADDPIGALALADGRMTGGPVVREEPGVVAAPQVFAQRAG